MSSSSFYPPLLPEGGRIGLVSPSRWAAPARLKALKNALESRGLEVVVHPQNEQRYGWLAGAAKDRAAAIMDMFLDPSIDAIMCVRGGTGALEILPLLDYKAIAAHPKPFVGYSDITCLLHAITRHTGMVTYHGMMSWQEGRFDPRSLEDSFHVISCGSQAKSLTFPQAHVRREGCATGPLIGGNLSLLSCLAGTDYLCCPKEFILFVEDVDEPLYVLDRTLTHLRLAGFLESVSAVIVGEMCDIEDETPNPDEPPEAWFGQSLEVIIEKHIPSHVPLAFNVPCGHGAYVTTLPFGAMVKTVFSKSGLSVSFAP
ncbi:MAG: LD-carboxypeptidase [Bdellovibrionales bacterium]